MAIDGVAPRAKMNQQRSRRFRSAKDAKDALEELETKVDSSQVFDSNCITPGTQFMARLDQCLRSFIRKKLKTDEVWKRFKIIYSGHGTPGEGEHKIMEYIRAQKSRKDSKHWSPNQRHCVYGLDADLIMLGLVSHEPHFCLLREEIDFTSFRKNKNTTKTVQKQTKRVKWQLLSLGVLREYLHVEFSSLKDTTEFFNVESVIDDFVRGVRERSARISIISLFRVSGMSLKVTRISLVSLIHTVQENHSKIRNAQSIVTNT